VLVIDDYIKNYKEAMSAAYLEDIWNWWLTVARTRLEPGAVVIVLATRWVANDLHGRLMKKQKETGRSFFEYVELPAIAHEGENDPIGRSPGDVLFPERYNTQSIYDIKAELGSRWFNAMFQQRPQDEEGRRYNAMLKGDERGQCTWMRGWDLASTKEAGDYTSGALCLFNKATGEFYVRNIARGQWSSHKVEDKFQKLAEEESINFKRHGVHYKIGMEREPGSSGVYTINHFKKILSQNEIEATLYESVAGTAKLLNAQPLLAAAENGKVFVVDDSEPDRRDNIMADAHWIKQLYDELDTFPEGEHDDQVDSMAITYKLLSGKSILKPTFGRNRDTATPGGPPQTRDMVAKSRVGLTFGRRLARVRA
jgi:predicted phage terminase large subunit-like protein